MFLYEKVNTQIHINQRSNATSEKTNEMYLYEKVNTKIQIYQRNNATSKKKNNLIQVCRKLSNESYRLAFSTRKLYKMYVTAEMARIIHYSVTTKILNRY